MTPGGLPTAGLVHPSVRPSVREPPSAPSRGCSSPARADKRPEAEGGPTRPSSEAGRYRKVRDRVCILSARPGWLCPLATPAMPPCPARARAQTAPPTLPGVLVWWRRAPLAFSRPVRLRPDPPEHAPRRGNRGCASSRPMPLGGGPGVLLTLTQGRTLTPPRSWTHGGESGSRVTSGPLSRAGEDPGARAQQNTDVPSSKGRSPGTGESTLHCPSPQSDRPRPGPAQAPQAPPRATKRFVRTVEVPPPLGDDGCRRWDPSRRAGGGPASRHLFPR